MSVREVAQADSVRLAKDGSAVVILDQTLLPGETRYLSLTRAEDMYEAIHSLRVRGAPAIGIFAAASMAVLAMRMPEEYGAFHRAFFEASAYLDGSRPTAVNLGTMLRRMENVVEKSAGTPVREIRKRLVAEAEAIRLEDVEMCRAISEYGLTLVKDGDGVLTHCNAGPMATSRYGTGQGTFFLAQERGIRLHAWCDETRPLMQGARLTSYELTKAGIDCTLICDNMASVVMKQGKIQACFVGCDRCAVNGDVANKIGTSGVAILAKYYGIPFYVFCPSSTIDWNCPSGDRIPVEERNADEIKTLHFASPMALPETKCYNPAFDVTDHTLVTAIVTERGVVRAPYEENFRNLFGRQKDDPIP